MMLENILEDMEWYVLLTASNAQCELFLSFLGGIKFAIFLVRLMILGVNCFLSKCFYAYQLAILS